MVRKDLGMVTAYAYAVSKGYTGTEEEFAELMASYASVAESAEASAQAAAGSASSAAGSATNASGSASAAAGSASAAASSASTASTKASESATSATAAAGSATTASTKAGEAASSASAAARSATQAAGSASAAAQSATDANTAKTDAQTAKTAAETAQGKAEEAQAAAEAAAQTLVIDDTLTQANQAAEAKAVGDALKTKAEVDGYYQDMTVGDAEQLVSSQYVEDNVPYKFRTSGGSADVGNREYVDKVAGGTIAWNQLALPKASVNVNRVSFMWDKTRFSISGTASSSGGRLNGLFDKFFDFIGAHVYLLLLTETGTVPKMLISNTQTGNVEKNINTSGIYKPDVSLKGIIGANVLEGNEYNGTTSLSIHDLTQMFGSTIANAIYAMEQATAGAGVAWFRSMFPADYYDYNAGELISVSGLQSHDTVGFNLWDEETESGYWDTNTGEKKAGSNWKRCKNPIPVFPNTAYFFKTTIPASGSFGSVIYLDSEGKVISHTESTANTINRVITTPAGCAFIVFYANKTWFDNPICINLSHNGSRNGEYASYEKHSYPLDSSLTLRGIPKLSADNQLYFVGDEYLPDGRVNRKCKLITFDGSSATGWRSVTTYGTVQRFDYVPVPADNGKVNMAISNYMPVALISTPDIECFNFHSSAGSLQLQIAQSKLSSVSVDGLMAYFHDHPFVVVYELVTPAPEETAEPFNSVQLVDDWGTEEYVSDTICPVGHETRYPANLRDKLQHLPDLASADGYYVIQQTGSQMSLVHFRIPQAPSADGTYTLKATVSGGNPTYTWEVVT